MRIFIDTNKYLDFYRGSDHSLVVINSLIEVIELGKVELIIPKQVLDEFSRDKDIIFKNFIQENFQKIIIPGFLSGDKKISKVNKVIDKLKVDYEKKFYSPKSKINIAFKKLFSVAIIKEDNIEVLNLAHYRTLRGNPPRKDNRSFGDAIIWETLLQFYSDKDIILISGDGDFSSEKNPSELNQFLKDEWHLKNKKKIVLQPSLGKFINEITKNKNKITKEVIEEEASLDRNIDLSKVYRSGIFTPQNISASSIWQGGTAAFYKTFCQCCGKEIENNGMFSIVMNNRCGDCSDQFSTPRNCSKCGKHFHESYLSTSYDLSSMTYLHGYMCPECKK